MTEPSAGGPRFAVAGAYVDDCLIRPAVLPARTESRQARSIQLAPGGKILNMAIALARQCAQVDSIGVVGDGPAGQLMLDTLATEGVGTRPSTCAPASLRPSAPACRGTAFLWHIHESAAITAAALGANVRSVLAQADAVMLTYESPAAVHSITEMAAVCGADGESRAWNRAVDASRWR